MEHPRILLQLDSDEHASSFDAVVAVDAGVEHLLQYPGIGPTNLQGLIHGAMFTRGPAELKNTAIFIGGSDVVLGESIAAEVADTFFGPVRVSVMLDANGSNTTAVAAVLCAARHVLPENSSTLVLGGTGPVGQRVARLLLGRGGKVTLTSRSEERAAQACEQVESKLQNASDGRLQPAASSGSTFEQALASCNVIVSCGAAGAKLLDAQQLTAASKVKVAIDLNAVPPAGIEGIEVTDKAKQRGDRLDYGAIGVGGLKMKIHRQAIKQLFSRNDLFLDAEEIYEIGEAIESSRSA